MNQAKISYEDYIRTTEPRHKNAVDYLWNVLQEVKQTNPILFQAYSIYALFLSLFIPFLAVIRQKGYIYLGKYEGWYSISDEEFLVEDEVEVSIHHHHHLNDRQF